MSVSHPATVFHATALAESRLQPEPGRPRALRTTNRGPSALVQNFARPFGATPATSASWRSALDIQ
eukprot:5460922-Pyramimonas_sp.AAC.1